MSPYRSEVLANLEMAPELKQLGQDCISLMAEQRPAFLEITKRLQKMKGYRFLLIFFEEN